MNRTHMTPTELNDHDSHLARLAQKYPRGSRLRLYLSLGDRYRLACFEGDHETARKLESKIESLG